MDLGLRAGISVPDAVRYTSSTRPLDHYAVDAVVVPVFGDGAVPAAALSSLGPDADDLVSLAARLDLREAGAHAWVSGGVGRPDLLLTSVGPRTGDGEARPGDLRVAAMTAGRTVDRPRVASLLAAASPSDPTAAAVVTEGWAMGAYMFDVYRSDRRSAACEELVVWGSDPEAVREGAVLGEATNVARDLVNTPASDLPPQGLAARCCELGDHHGFTVRAMQGKELSEGGFGGLVAVGAGSPHPPLLLELERGDPDMPHIALVGKGITFDSGGLSLKTTDGMRTMKADMSGAASIVGALIASDRLALPAHVKAYLACAENMPGHAALRIGDVIRHRNGLSTEVLDTDCEGRLVLSDVLAFAAESSPTRLIDIATIAAGTGLGHELWAGLGTDRELIGQLLTAGAASGEPGWELPLWEGYADRLRSDVADIKNCDAINASGFAAVYAALYLRHFVGSVPWAHIDLGLTVMRPAATASWSAGANGNGTRTLARYLLATARSGAVSGPAHHTHPEN